MKKPPSEPTTHHPTRDQNAAPARRWRDHQDEVALAELVKRNIGLAKSHAARWRHSSVSFEDRAQVALMALYKAACRFDPDRGSLSTWALPFIRRAVSDLLSRDTRTGVSIPDDKKRRRAGFKLGAVRAQLLADGAEPTPAALAPALRVSKAVAAALDQAQRPPLPLDHVPTDCHGLGRSGAARA